LNHFIELGLDTFGDITVGVDGNPESHAQVIRNVIEEAVLADAVGIDFIGLGEHHRADFAISSPEMVLAAIAARTTRIRLGSAVTVLSSDDPVRVFQRFATLDAVSAGRAEVILGRGSFTEPFRCSDINSVNMRNCSKRSSISLRHCSNKDRSRGRAQRVRPWQTSGCFLQSNPGASRPGSESEEARNR
jgi:hypothetical protein